ncbi:Transcription factor RF2a [Dichanthelium oligosanthes]|uniref:Transcription factor RF2a n=1 Tax=Dichanthelium oligosanthes TaxID=888268 RepID=A0A1E5VII4_9POAL|nr:Transcription factor RF2a [Dichanthelium oligosanthes]
MNTANGHGLMHHHHHHVQASMPPPPQHQKQQRAGLPPTPPPAGPGSHSHSLHHGDACMDDSSAAARAQAQAQGGLPPRKQAHRRSRSDVAFGYFQPLPPPSLKTEAGGWGGLPGGGGAAAGDDLFNAYMSMEGMDGLNNSDGDSRGSSGMRTNGGADSSENESEDYGGGGGGADSQFLLWGGDAGKKKRNAAGEPAPPPPARHARSLSMDSLMGKLSFSANGEPGKFSLEFGGGEFTPAEMKRIMADEKLAEMALADPKRVKRVLANRQSAARSKERRMRYIAELEQKVQILQTEATTLSAQLTLLQRDSAGLATQNNELKFRLQAMEQQAQLRDALNEALTTEVQRLKLGETSSSSNMSQQMQLRSQNQMMEMHKQQGEQIPFYQLEQREQNGAPRNHDPK